MNPSLDTIPEGLDVLHTPEGTIIRRVWLTWKIVPLGLFAIFWDGFLFFWYSKVLSTPHPPLMAVFFPIGHIAVGIGITYYVFAALVNKTDIVVSSSGVRVTSGPAPWIGNKEVRADEMTRVLVRERTVKNGRAFNVMYADLSCKERKLVTSLAEHDQAHFIAATIEQNLGLKSHSDRR